MIFVGNVINRLLWICEDFFDHNDNKYHEICFYYLIECNDNSILNKGDLFYITEGKNEFEFKWVDINDIKNEIIYPVFIKNRIQDLPLVTERIVEINE